TVTIALRKSVAFLCLALLVFSTAITPAQQSQAAEPASSIAFRTLDLPDSQQYFERATRHAKPKVDAAAIERLLKRMTLKEKVGQMTQLEIGMVSTGIDANITIDPAKLHKAVVEYGVGSILNVKD